MVWHPNFSHPTFDLNAILIIAPVALILVAGKSRSHQSSRFNDRRKSYLNLKLLLRMVWPQRYQVVLVHQV